MANKTFLLTLPLMLAACSGEENSPEMGAVPPKPDARIAAKLPPEIQAQMKNAKVAEAKQTADMAERAQNLKKH